MSGNNQIVYPSGAKLTRKIGSGSEVWEFDNQSLNDSEFTLDLAACSKITFEDGSYDHPKTVNIKHLQKKDIFKLIKNPGWKFAPRFNLKENPISLEEQK